MLGSAFFLVALLVIGSYIVVIASLNNGWSKALLWQNVSRVTFENPTFISVIVPVRNEESNLESLFLCLELQEYPADLFEIIVVNDHSEDNTTYALNKLKSKSKLNIETLDLSYTSGKKEALATGIDNAKGELVITIDADCEYGKLWLKTIALHHQEHQKDFYVLPVTNRSPVNFFEQFQGMEFLTLVGAGISSFGWGDPILCNGANLCFTKACYETVNGYHGNFHQSSGDDVFLLHKVKHQKGLSIGLIMSMESCAITKPEKNFQYLIHQRVRWASKSGIYKDTFTSIIAMSFFMVNLYLFAGLILSLVIPSLWVAVLAVFAIRVTADWVYLRRILKWFNWPKSFQLFLFFEILYPFYTIVVIMASLFLKPVWKGRQINTNTHQIKKA